jgi:glucose uptake protein GlcU
MQGSDFLSIFSQLDETIQVCIVGFIALHLVGIGVLLGMHFSDNKKSNGSQFSKMKAK